MQLLPLFVVLLPLAAEVRVTFDEARSLGKLDGFYRGTQLQGHLLRDRLGLTRVPTSLRKTSFPYQARSSSEEVLFSDTLSFVRFLGGYNPTWKPAETVTKENDLAYVNQDGKVCYRWELVAPRLDPYLQAGYRDFVISLDNVPRDLAANPVEGTYGQVSPARDLREWESFIEGFCRHLVKLYGSELPNRWSFRMGTEPNGGAGHTFNGGHDKYIAMYDATAKAVKRVLPRAPFGPGEFSGGVSPQGPPAPLVNYVKLAEHCHRTGVPFDFLSNSSHSVPRWVGKKLDGAVDPRQRVEINLSSYHNILAKYPEFRGGIYIFQFGVLRSEFRVDGQYLATHEPGGRGAAWTFHVLMEMKAREPRLKGIWHWGAGERIDRRDPDRFLLYGNGWLYSILDHCIGGEAWLLRAPESQQGTLYQVMLVRKDEASYLLASAFNVDRKITRPETLRIVVPPGAIDAVTNVSFVRLTEETSVFRAIKRDLKSQGLLKPEYASPDLLACVATMSGPRGLRHVRDNFQKYEQMQIDALTLKPFDGAVNRSEHALEFVFSAVPGSVTVIKVDSKNKPNTKGGPSAGR